jgi:hypothetical protein
MIQLLAITLHIALALLHVILLMVYLMGLENRIVKPVSDNTIRFTTLINSANQIFIVVSKKK